MSNLEKQSSHQEKERNPEAIEAAGKEQREHLKQEIERAAAITSERDHDAATAQLEALKQAKSSESVKEAHSRREASPAERRQGPITRKQLDLRFKRTMKVIQEDLPPTGRAFSKFIHAKPVEKVSDFLGSTIARPNALLAGAIGAFALTLAIYIFAKNMGYRLSGFEPIAAFAIGWIIGLLYDYLKVMITGKKS